MASADFESRNEPQIFELVKSKDTIERASLSCVSEVVVYFEDTLSKRRSTFSAREFKAVCRGRETDASKVRKGQF